tara:strand:- start:9812 stop:12217 length:2406 start_codon:yes stop_codon:yes gene_type:complete
MTFEVSGKVIDSETNEPLEYATIYLNSKSNSKLVFGGLTDENGKFVFDVKPGMYELKIDYLNFISYSNEELLVNKNIDLGSIPLNLDFSMLDEVEVRAERTEVEIRLDKKIYNVGQDITVRGGSVSDVLANIPSLEVDIDGNVSLRGNNNVKILINGKPSGIIGLSGPEGLRSIPSESIQQVEVVTSPSARYEAEGTAGILNIILKKQDLLGFNGNVNLNLGIPESTGLNGSFNLRNNKINFFNTTSIKHGSGDGYSFAKTTYSNLTIDERTDWSRDDYNFFTTLGVEYYIDDKTSLILSGVYKTGVDNSFSTNIVKDISIGDIRSVNDRLRDEREDEFSNEYAVDFFKDFDEEGHTLSARVSFETNNDDGIEDIEDFSSFPNRSDSSFEKVSNLDEQNRFLAQVDYVYPINKNTQFELGYRGRKVDRITDYDVSYLVDEVYNSDPGLSNIFAYNEFVNAFYTQYGKKVNKLSYLIGLRFENSKQEIDQRTTNQFEIKNYSDWFPTFNLAYEFSKMESITFGYSKRIRRPRGWNINPFPRRNSITSLFRGNPFLDPTFTNSLEIGYLKRVKKFTINTEVFYSNSKKNNVRITEETGELITVTGGKDDESNPTLLVPVLDTYPINLSENTKFGGVLNLTYTPSRSVRLNGSFTLNNNKVRGEYKNQNFNSDNTSWNARFSSFIKLPLNVSWQLFGFFRGPSETAQSRNKAFGTVTSALQKNILENKGTISVKISDLFNTGKWRYETFTDTFFREGEGQWREPSYTLTLSYRFNEKNNKRSRKQRSNDLNFGRGDDQEPIFNN